MGNFPTVHNPSRLTCRKTSTGPRSHGLHEWVIARVVVGVPGRKVVQLVLLDDGVREPAVPVDDGHNERIGDDPDTFGPPGSGLDASIAEGALCLGEA